MIRKRKGQADLQKSLTSNSVPCLSYPISQTLRSSHWLNADGRNSEQGETKKVSQLAWQVLKVALLFPILGKVLPRDLSPLKPLLVEGVWDRVRSRLVPVEAGGTVPIRDF
ncbi:MAG: hypothetical protein ACO2PP_18860 [Thermocrinis sp.]|uniref:hypothetical protein n=1 Tax=Thermocrinis sp. TaxID=2024383 RepID=UPI003C018F9C